MPGPGRERVVRNAVRPDERLHAGARQPGSPAALDRHRRNLTLPIHVRPALTERAVRFNSVINRGLHHAASGLGDAADKRYSLGVTLTHRTPGRAM